MKSALLAVVLLGSCCTILSAQTTPAANPSAAETAKAESSIREAIKAQADAWNRADVDAFMQSYEDSPDTTFIGMTLRKGYKPILERYKQNYTTPEQMGKLSFTDLDIRLLPGACGKAELALVTGKFHLERTAKGEAKKDDGIFSLVWRKGPTGWKIILDHTS
ncbi:YybH family protein [Terracidiphilus sp.]|jgi:ketosteroid isomerase-like protein|uniref:YybH family protein n=1 Tax=Terracidiphilus sp. TaxID=1964191 RepID=UPI003C15204B